MTRLTLSTRRSLLGWTAAFALPGALAWAEPVTKPAPAAPAPAAPAAAPPAPRPAPRPVVAQPVPARVPVATTAAPAAKPAAAATPRAAGAKGLEWVPKYEDAIARAKKERKIVLLDFYTDWCGWCKRLDADVFAKDSFVQAADGVLGVKINAERLPELAAKYQVSSYPRLFFLDSNGVIVERIRGYMNLDEFTLKVAAVKKGETEYARLRAAAMDPTDLVASYRFGRYLSEGAQHEAAIPYWQQVHDLALQQIFQQPVAPGPMNYHRESLIELARGYSVVGLDDVASQHYAEVLRVYPDNPATSSQALVGLAQLEAKKEPANIARAQEYLDRVVREYPGTPAMAEAARIRQGLAARTVSAKGAR